jgi:hypothetical protein
MFRTRIARILLVPAAAIVPLSITAVALSAGTANAATAAPKDVVTCTKLTGKVNIVAASATGTFSGCTSSITGGTGKFSGSESSSSGSVTWKNKGVTTMSFGFNTGGTACGSNKALTEIVVTGTVSGSTGAASKIAAGQEISGGKTKNTADFCWNSNTNALTLAPKTKFEI